MILLSQVHYQRSVKRVAERLNKGSGLGFKAFTTIGYAIPKAVSKEDVITLFDVLCGKKALSAAIDILPEAILLLEYKNDHNPENWKPGSSWRDWWCRSNHLSMCEKFCRVTFYKCI